MKFTKNIKIDNDGNKALAEKILSYPYWRHRINLGNGFFTPGYITENLWKRTCLPDDLTGKSFLDIGANDGMISFLAEKKGAELVTAMDMYNADYENRGKGWSDQGIRLVKEYLSSEIEIVSETIYGVESLKRAYNVIFVGDVLVWLDNPLLALEKISAICKDQLVIRDGFWTQYNSMPALKYGQNQPFVFIPNIQFVIQSLKNNGFKKVEAVKLNSFEPVLEMSDFSLVRINKGVKIYSDPFKNKELKVAGSPFNTILTARYNNMVHLKLTGWVESDQIKIINYKDHPLKKVIMGVIGEKNFYRLKGHFFEKGNGRASYVIIATK